MSFISRVVKFLKEARVELKKVTWLSRQETIKYTLIVTGISLAVAIFLGAWDFIFNFLLKTFILK